MPDQKVLDTVANAKLDHLIATTMQLPGASSTPAASTRNTADYLVLTTWAVTLDNDLLLLNILRDRLEGPDQPKLFKQAYDRWQPKFQTVESTGLGKTLFRMLVSEGLPVKDLLIIR